MVYVVDDAADYRFLVQHVFRLSLPQYPVRLFGDGLELIQAIETGVGGAETERPKLILLDVDMPKLSGPQTLEKLQQLPGWATVPVVMLSNRFEDLFVRACYERGGCSFISKPLDINQLTNVLRLLCQYWLDLNRLPDPSTDFAPATRKRQGVV